MGLQFMEAQECHLPAIMRILTDDAVASKRDVYSEPLLPCYTEAFAKISQDKNNFLFVLLEDSEVIGCLQLTLTQYLSRKGCIRATIDTVRIASGKRSKGYGTKMFQYALAFAKENGAQLVQLTTDKKRPDALRFYERLGFKNSHEGLKMQL